MSNDEFIKYIESFQNRIDIPECFELSQELLESHKSLETLITRLLINNLRNGEKYAILEIIKQWLANIEEAQS